ncbi:MAG: DUF6145 family protein [Clostridiales bacterium]|nr:DUF6145 family protein [Clostridiales bacterium]
MDRVLCGANAQSMKYFFNEEEFGKLPGAVRDELKAMCVSYCADVGGVITLVFDDENHLHFQTVSPIDEIGAELKIRKYQRDNAELFGQLERFASEVCGRKDD